ncbi:MAG: hypothetical protein IT443_01620 [Phycisphaeraceae bacterium]|nr:hypothetical protein [Phycisphaeraceae bacterium]
MKSQYVPAVVLVGVGLVFGTECGAATSLNLAESLADTKAKLAAHAGVTNILALGDSLTYQSQSWLPVFRGLMAAEHGNAGAGYQGFSLWTGGGFNAGWTMGRINQDTIPHHSLDGLWAGAETAGRTAYLDAWEGSIELQYLVQPGGGRIQVENYAHQVIGVIDTQADAQGLGTFTHDFGAEQKRLWFRTLDDKPVTIMGENNVRDDAGVRIHRAANGGWGVNNFLQRDATFDQQVELMNPDLIMIWLGQNDQAYNRTTYAARLNLLVDRLQAAVPDAEIVLVGTRKANSWLSRMAGAMEDVAQARGLGYVDLYHTAGDQAYYTAQGMLQADGIHFSQLGGNYIGQLMYDVFVNEGANLVEGVLGDFNEDGQVTLSDVVGFRSALIGEGLAAHYGDVSEDGEITLSDIPYFRAALASGGGTATAVPEPGGLVVMGVAGLWMRRRRR